MSYIGTVSRPAVNNIIPDNSITAAKIVDGAIVAADLAENSVGASELDIANITGVLPVGVTGGSGLDAISGVGGSTFTAVADGAIAAGDECIVTSAGKLAKIASSTSDVYFGPSTAGLFNDWSTGNGFRQYEIYDKLWNHAQSLSPNPFASEDAMKQAAYNSFTNASWGINFHQDGSGGYGNMTQIHVNTSGVYSDYYLTVNSITCISATGSAPNTTNLSTLFSWLTYKQLVFRFQYSATVTNVTATNFCGWADGAYADGVSATINLKGTIETGLTGLTTGSSYYIQKNGTLSTTTDDPSVLAGVALTTNKLLVG